MENTCCATQIIFSKRLGYFGGWKDWGEGHDGPPPPPLEISAVDRAVAAEICTMVVCDVIYKIVYLDFPKIIFFYFISINYANLCEKSGFLLYISK